MNNLVRKKRLEKGLNQTELAEKAKISRPYLSGIEKGTNMPGTAVAISIAKALDTTVEAIFLTKVSYKDDKRKETAK